MSSDRPKMDMPTAMALLTPARHTREQVDHFNPLVLFTPRRGQPQMAILDGDGTLAEQLDVLLGAMRAKLGPPVWIAVTTDAYVKPAVEPSEVQPGALADAFAEGDPQISEQMVVLLRHRFKPTEVAAQTYRYLPSEGWEWDEPELIENHEGAVMKVLDYYII